MTDFDEALIHFKAHITQKPKYIFRNILLGIYMKFTHIKWKQY
jgi:hypothetical protein